MSKSKEGTREGHKTGKTYPIILESIINQFTCAYFTEISAFVFLKSWNLHKKKNCSTSGSTCKTIDNIRWHVFDIYRLYTTYSTKKLNIKSITIFYNFMNKLAFFELKENLWFHNWIKNN